MPSHTSKLRGKIYHIAKAIHAQSKINRLKFVSLAETYQLDEYEKKACEILKRNNFCFTAFWDEINPEWGKYSADLFIKMAKQEYFKKN